MTSPAPRWPTRTSRRTYLAALGAGVLSSLAGCSIGANPGIASEALGPSGGDDGGGTDDGWGRHTKLAPAADGVGHFGASVALAADATTALVSATYHEGPDGLKPGPAYVLGRIDGGWRLQATLPPDDGDSTLSFGWKGGSTALSADGTTALVGADKADEPNGPRSGAAYAFERTDVAWGRAHKLVPDDGGSQDFFGRSTALSADGTTALVGAWGHDHPDGAGSGAAYVFERVDDGWSQAATLAPESAGAFGSSVALGGDGTVALIGAPAADTPDGAEGGTAYAFERADGGTWRRQTTLAPADGDVGDFFGGSVALEGDTAIVGAPEDDDPNGERAGSSYVFERTDGAWSQRAKLVPDDGDTIDLFGVAVALTSDATTALVGARVDEDPNGEQAGSAYVLGRTDGAWSQTVKLAPADGESHDVFGRSVALAGDTALVGTARGKAYVF